MVAYRSRKRLSGHAGLMFAMIFPVLFGMFIWATDGARMLQSDARLTDAMEVAVLAVAAGASDEDTERQAIAQRFVAGYFPDVDNANITVTSSKQPKTEGSGDEQVRFFEYSLTVSINRETLFNDNNTSLSYGNSFNMGRTSQARKGLSEAVDVVLVADYSASMFETWSGGNQRKFKDLNDITNDIADELEHYNEQNPTLINTLAVVGFDFYTSQVTTNYVEKDVKVGEECYWERRKGKWRYVCEDVTEKQLVEEITRSFSHHLVCNDNTYWQSYGRYDYETSLTDDCYSNLDGAFQEWAIASDRAHNYIDASATVDNVFNQSHASNRYRLSESEVTNISVFEDISPSSDFEAVTNKVNDSNRFDISKSGGSGTSSYAGIIRAAQMAEAGSNPRRLIIILSDGVDSYSSITDKLINNGLCSSIVNHLESLTVDGKSVRAELAAIGFDYDVDANPQMKNCVGEGRVYAAQNTEDIKNKILSLISEEVGSLVR
ncbi:TadE/TadG family type IV pilus assembly protein [Marinomonas ostreistagni]|uniref:Flp pilus assembly protein TadG n=1 Tax=Marinomonas ostreistagni TaxID=359209 RepID=A0ABS0ZCU1_9GAMM|nr:hypothetical protein [Marinomonas ostreistagni]MBJ7551487.1 hypothetical protein [Marinomonas ostreistagni]